MRSALIIANTEYTDPGLAQLTAPGKDAEDFARVLQDKDICAFDDVNILLNQPEHIVRGTIDEFFDQKKPDDLLVLYFSGHGVRDELGALYLAVKNTIRTRLRSTAIKSDYIREAMDQSRSKRQVLILDCCNSGAFAQGTKAEIGGAMGMTTAFQGYGRFVLTASDATQFAWEGNKVIGETQNSLFTHFLVKGLEGEADREGDGKITVDELYDYTYEEISKVTPKQTPTKSASKQEGEIVLRQITRIEDIKPVSLSDQLVSEIENPYPEVRLRAIGQLAKLVAGKNLGLARSAREALERLAQEDDSHRVVLAAKQALQSAFPIASLTTLKVEEEGSQPAQQKVEEAPITQPGIKSESKASASGERERVVRERMNVIRAAREREQLERQLKLGQKPTTPAVPAKRIQEQQPSQQTIGRNGFMIGGVGLILLACVFGLIYASSHWPFTPPPSSSPTPTITELTSTLTSLPTDTLVPPPTTVSPTEAPPSPTNTALIPTTQVPPTSTPICNQAVLIQDVTIPDGTILAPGASFTKTWRLKNTGACMWTPNYSLRFDHGEQMGAPATQSLTAGNFVNSGASVDVSVNLRAPDAPGTYQANFKLVSPDGTIFGIGPSGQGAFWVKIKVAISTGTITGTAFSDNNGNGIPDNGEVDQGLTVTLYDSTGNTPLKNTTTDANGKYTFANLSPSTYYVKWVVNGCNGLETRQAAVNVNAGATQIQHLSTFVLC